MRTDRLLSDKSVNHYLQYLSALLRWTSLEEIIGGTPAEGLAIKKRQKDWEERFAFDGDQLQSLLRTLWSGEDRLERRWAPLTALWFGMRQEEVCQLRHCDVVERDGVYCFQITGEAGFLTEVWSQDKAEAKERLWPNLLKTKLQRYSNAACKWFSRYKQEKGFKDRRYCFHSLRHTFINAMKQQEVPEPEVPLWCSFMTAPV